MGTAAPEPPLAQSSGEFLEAWVLDVGSDIFGCGTGRCTLRYRMYHAAAGVAEVNMGPGMDGVPRFRRRGAYQTDVALSGNFPGAAGRYDIPFFVVWDGVLDSGSSEHVGYYGGQSQILRFGETGDSSQMNCGMGGKSAACFEPLSSATSSQTLQSGVYSVGGLAPIPVPRVTYADEESVGLEWDQARGMAITDAAPPVVVGYRIFAYPGSAPSQGSLQRARQVGEIPDLGATRLDVPRSHPGLPESGTVTFVIKLVYAGQLESMYFSANSEPLELESSEDPEEDEGEGEDEEADASDDEPGEDAEADGDPATRDDRGNGDAPDTGTAGGQTGNAPVPGQVSAGAAAGSEGRFAPEGDADGDGIANRLDNCAGLFNPLQEDQDGDAAGDACDGDTDGDGVADHRDCAPGDAAEGGATPTPPGQLLLGMQPGSLLTWQGSPGPWRLLRGTRLAGEPFVYNHTCLLGALTDGAADDPGQPDPASLYYYLVTGDAGCAVAAPGSRSDGRSRPLGGACLVVDFRAEGLEAEDVPWRVRAQGGDGQPLELELGLDLGSSRVSLSAVSLEVVYSSQRLQPVGTPVSGSLLAEELAPARVDYQQGPRHNRLRVTVARTGPGLSVDQLSGSLFTTRWRMIGSGPVILRLEKVQAMDTDFNAVPLPGVALRIRPR